METDTLISIESNNPDTEVIRSELKSSILPKNIEFLAAQLMDLNFIEHHVDREVFSIYLDTPQLDFFRQSEEGVTPRTKLRFRSYDDFKSAANLEIKRTFAYGRQKVVYPNQPYAKKPRFLYENIKLIPSLKVSYTRSYFVLGNIRLTIDQDIKIQRMDRLHHVILNTENAVLEVKAGNDWACRQVMFALGLQTTRFSKYCFGIKQTY